MSYLIDSGANAVVVKDKSHPDILSLVGRQVRVGHAAGSNYVEEAIFNTPFGIAYGVVAPSSARPFFYYDLQAERLILHDYLRNFNSST